MNGAVKTISKSDDPRVLVVSQRGLQMVAPRCMNYEFEDRIADMDRADVVTVETSLAVSRWGRRAARFRNGRAGSRIAPLLDRRYDLVFVNCQSVSDLIALGPIARWLACGERSVCWIDELWATTLPRRPYELAQLRHFDHVIMGCCGSVEGVHDLTNRPVDYLPSGIDAIGFCPYPDPPERSIDVYAMGRRSPETHRALLGFADTTGRHYLYDSIMGIGVRDAAEHRRLLASQIQRSKYFLAYRAKINEPGQTRYQEEVGFRFFEGAAGGAVMLGEPPNGSVFSELFEWPDAVIPLPYGSENVREIIEALEAAPDRIAAARRAGILGCLRRHDWLHRWVDILKSVGMQAGEGAEHRCGQLAQLTELLELEQHAAV